MDWKGFQSAETEVLLGIKSPSKLSFMCKYSKWQKNMTCSMQWISSVNEWHVQCNGFPQWMNATSNDMFNAMEFLSEWMPLPMTCSMQWNSSEWMPLPMTCNAMEFLSEWMPLPMTCSMQWNSPVNECHYQLDLCAKHTHAPTKAPFLTKAWLMNSTICLKWEFAWNMFITKRNGFQQDNRFDLLSIMCSISKAMATSQHWFSIKCQCIYPLFEITSETK